VAVDRTPEEQRKLDLAKEYISISYDPERASAERVNAHVVIGPSAYLPLRSFERRRCEKIDFAQTWKKARA
jgi:hypothetical protein